MLGDAPHRFVFDLDRAIGTQVIEERFEESPLLPLATGVGPNENGIYVLDYNNEQVCIGKASKETTR